MKNTILFNLAFLFSAITFAQGGINYKAVIKDASGSIVSNQAITIRFEVVSTSYVYVEEHNPTTDANGIIVVNIGEGTSLTGSFNTVDWSTDDYFLNVQVDTGNGLINLGTTPFKNVPYAIYAEKAGNVSGLETIDEGNGQGWRLIGQGSDDHQPIGLNAIDLSLEGPTGFFTGASGEGAIAIGVRNHAVGDYSMAVNHDTRADAMYSTAVGRFNNSFGNPTAWVATDPIFEIGNGTDIDFTSNALTVLKNGTILAPSFDIAEITTDKALITKEYFEFVETKGLEQITEGGNTGFRLVDKNPIQYGNIGNNAVDLSTSIGSDTNHGATGDRSLAVGASTIASGGNSIAMGFEAEASGGNAFAMGYRTKAEANSCLAIGSYNIGGGNPLNFTSTNPIFEIGNGTSPNGRSNALTVLQNGTVGIGIHTGMEGKVEIQSNSTATAPQLALIEDNASFARLKFKNTNRNGDDYWDIAGLIGTTVAEDRLNFFNSDGGNIMSLTGDGDVFVNGSLVHSSDRRLKREIETIDYGLAEILQLNPVQYNWQNKEDKTHKSLGVIAQEIQEIIPNVVQTSTDKNQTLSVSYTELIPVLIKAIQEQQKIIDSQQTQISTQDKRFSQLEAQLMNLIEGLENTNTSK